MFLVERPSHSWLIHLTSTNKNTYRAAAKVFDQQDDWSAEPQHLHLTFNFGTCCIKMILINLRNAVDNMLWTIWAFLLTQLML